MQPQGLGTKKVKASSPGAAACSEVYVSKRLYVGNLPYSATEDELRNLFSQYGEVDRVDVATDRETGRARGFAFVDMANDAGANAAIQSLNGYTMDGRPLKVDEARPRPEPEGMRAGRGYGGGGRGY
jgi:cold-inducible RNA-binding protein